MYKTKSLLFVFGLLALVFALSCGDGDPQPPDARIVYDATPVPDAPQPDATPAITAENLGLPCAGANNVPCPTEDEVCITLTGIGSQTEGFCTIPCDGQGDTVSCSNGYVGNGQPQCAVNDGAGGFLCLVACQNVGGAGECDPGLQCAAGGNPAVCVGDE